MEKGKLIVEESKNKKIIVHIHFTETSKKMPFPQLQTQLKNTSMNGMDVEIERDRGNILSVKSVVR